MRPRFLVRESSPAFRGSAASSKAPVIDLYLFDSHYCWRVVRQVSVFVSDPERLRAARIEMQAECEALNRQAIALLGESRSHHFVSEGLAGVPEGIYLHPQGAA